MNQQQSVSKSPLRRIVWVLVFIAVFLLILNLEKVIDTANYFTYQPSAEIQAIPDAAGLSENGKFLLYASRTTIDGTQNFRQQCGDYEPTSAMLGCYFDRKIYLFDVNDNELDGVVEVTAAHEMLHAAYDRLSRSERETVARSLKQLNDKLSAQNPDYKKRMAVYSDLPEASYINELHSVIGTEISDVGSELDDYYSKYFDDRQKTLRLYAKYSGVFKKSQQEAEQLAQRIDELAASINNRTDSYNSAVEKLDNDIQIFNDRAESGYYSSRSNFEADRRQLVSRQADLDKDREQINAEIVEYEAKKKQLDAQNLHLIKLNNSLDSSLAPAPKVEN